MRKQLMLAATAATGFPLAIAWAISNTLMHPRPRVEDHGLSDFGLTAEDVSFPSRDGTRLAGWFIPAAAATPAPAVVLSHGWARSRAELMPHAGFLHRAGYAVLLFDYRHRGESAGTAITMAVREQDDLLGAIDYACRRPEVDASRVALEGLSMGSVIAILVAARDQRVRAVVAECPYANYRGMMDRALRHYAHLPSFLFADLGKLVLERRIGLSLDSAQPEAVVDQISPRPIFIIADQNDEVIGCAQTERVFQAAAEPKRFWLIEGGGHSRGWQAMPQEYERRVVDFLREALGAIATNSSEERHSGAVA